MILLVNSDAPMPLKPRGLGQSPNKHGQSDHCYWSSRLTDSFPRNKLNFNSACNNYLYSFFAIVDEGVTAADIL